MLFMVTNRRVINGKYGDEQRRHHRFEYQYQYNHKERGKDGFGQTGRDGFEKALMSELARIKREHNTTPKVGIYIHGFKNDYQDSIDEIHDLHHAMAAVTDIPPVIIGFSWPSAGIETHYLSDREEVRDSVGAFTRFLIDINDLATRNERDCFSSIFCIAHSMGNYLLRKGMEYLSDYLGNPKGRMLFDETVLLAPDISSKDIEKDGKGSYISDFSRRVHVYYSKYDRALKASSIKRFGASRLGRHGALGLNNLPDNLVMIDARKFANSDSLEGIRNREDKQVSVHNGHRYHPAILRDVLHVLASVDRELIPNREAVVDENCGMPNHFRLT